MTEQFPFTNLEYRFYRRDRSPLDSDAGRSVQEKLKQLGADFVNYPVDKYRDESPQPVDREGRPVYVARFLPGVEVDSIQENMVASLLTQEGMEVEAAEVPVNEEERDEHA